MLYENCTTLLLGLKDIAVTNFDEEENYLIVDIISLKETKHCPHCGCKTHAHGYRWQPVKDLAFRGKTVILRLKKKRYICVGCGKTFFEKPEFLPRYHRMTRRLYQSIIREMRKNYSMKSVAQQHDVSPNTVSRIFDIVNYSLNKMPSVLSIDEFKGNAGREKYQCILADPQRKKVLDILRSREKSCLIDYFLSFKDRKRVKFLIMDMWKPYKDLSWLFPDATVIVDKFHYTRQVYWALDRVRKRVQKLFVDQKRKYFKRSKKLLFAPFKSLLEESKAALNLMLTQHDDLFVAWQLKELFLDFKYCGNAEEGKKVLRQWILTVQNTSLSEFKDCITAFLNWFIPIVNSLDCPYTNGFVEGTNNKIKVLKRNAYGYRNFNRFRNRILHCCA